jgi:hypothetical protein
MVGESLPPSGSCDLGLNMEIKIIRPIGTAKAVGDLASGKCELKPSVKRPILSALFLVASRHCPQPE